MNHAPSGVVSRSRVRRSALNWPYEPRAVRCGSTVPSSTLGTQLAVRASLGPPAVIDRHRHRCLQRGTAQQATHLSGHDHGHVCRFEIVGHLNIRETIKARHFKFSTQIGHMKCLLQDDRQPSTGRDHGHVIFSCISGISSYLWNE